MFTSFLVRVFPRRSSRPRGNTLTQKAEMSNGRIVLDTRMCLDPCGLKTFWEALNVDGGFGVGVSPWHSYALRGSLPYMPA